MDKEEVEKRYLSLLGGYLKERSGRFLEEMGALAQEMVLEEVSPEFIVDFHEKALLAVGEDIPPLSQKECSHLLCTILHNMLKYYGDGYREQQGRAKAIEQALFEANAEVTRKNEELEKLIRKLKNSQAGLIQAEKMSAVGNMTAGLAHELNNPMMGILNFIQYCLKHTSPEEKSHEVLKDAQREVRRCIHLVKNLLTFSRTGVVHKSAYEKGAVADILDRVLSLVSYRSRREGIEVVRRYDPATPPIWMRPDEMEQVFLNFIVNAMDALEGVGHKKIFIDTGCEDRFLEVAFTDTGKGVSSEREGKIFEPFYTTKAKGKGTGMGLSICYSIVEEHGGRIFCQGNPGMGATFKVLLPIDRRNRNPENGEERG